MCGKNIYTYTSHSHLITSYHPPPNLGAKLEVVLWVGLLVQEDLPLDHAQVLVLTQAGQVFDTGGRRRGRGRVGGRPRLRLARPQQDPLRLLVDVDAVRTW